MTNNEKMAEEIAKQIWSQCECEVTDGVLALITEALNAAQAEGYKQGAEKMREDAAKALQSESVKTRKLRREPDWVIVDAAYSVAKRIIEALPITPPQTGFQPPGPSPASMGLGITPPQPAAEDDEREMRVAFERDITNDDGNKPPLCEESYKAGWQAAWKEKSK